MITYNDARRFGYMLLIPEGELGEHPLMRGLGVEPLSPELTPDLPRAPRRGQGGRPQGVPVRPAHRRWARQHLRVRGAVSRRASAQAQGGDPRHQRRAPNRAGRPLGRCHPRGAQGCDRGGRLLVARLPRAPTARSAPSSTPSPSTAARTCRACARAAAARCGVSCRAAARPSIVPSASAEQRQRRLELAVGENGDRRQQCERDAAADEDVVCRPVAARAEDLARVHRGRRARQ